jgi:hypothetical protein
VRDTLTRYDTRLKSPTRFFPTILLLFANTPISVQNEPMYALDPSTIANEPLTASSSVDYGGGGGYMAGSPYGSASGSPGAIKVRDKPWYDLTVKGLRACCAA